MEELGVQRVSPIRKLVLVMIGVTLALSLGTSADAETDDVPGNGCVTDTAWVEDIGHACRTADGLYHMFGPNGEDLGYTHGPDPIPSDEQLAPLDGPGRLPICTDGTDTDYYGVLIYARAHDDEDRFDEKKGDIQSLFMRANEVLYQTAQEHLATRDYIMHCTDGRPTVLEAVLPTDKDNAYPGSIFNDIHRAGFNDGRVKYWIWYDDTGACGCGGIGHIYNDDRAIEGNYNNGNAGAMKGITFGYNSWSIMMHENGHNLGVVQLSSPQSSGGFHCNDGIDVMCYADGGSTSNYAIVCPTGPQWDCNGDDYFNPLPVPGTYLFDHWNLGADYVRYIDGEDLVIPDTPEIPCINALRDLGLCA